MVVCDGSVMPIRICTLVEEMMRPSLRNDACGSLSTRQEYFAIGMADDARTIGQWHYTTPSFCSKVKKACSKVIAQRPCCDITARCSARPDWQSSVLDAPGLGNDGIHVAYINMVRPRKNDPELQLHGSLYLPVLVTHHGGPTRKTTRGGRTAKPGCYILVGR
jgi:hypothetical protein